MDARNRALDYLQTHHVMTVATAGADGPAAAAVFYVSHGLDLYFLSAPHSRHCVNLQVDRRVAVTIQDAPVAWPEIRGLQLSGTVRQLDGADADDARRLYSARFPDVPVTGGATGTVARALLGIRWYGLVIEHLRFIDNSRGFGHRDEWSRGEFLRGAAALESIRNAMHNRFP